MRIVFRKNGREIPFRSLENSIPSERNDAVPGRFIIQESTFRRQARLCTIPCAHRKDGAKV